ncbi:MAG: hypothetical protein GF368_02800 [Candidatus Aenigmarchaeota archaeon]|nr:hypothetical protein [Candidatus Aenigmarchaeota archaeon]
MTKGNTYPMDLIESPFDIPVPEEYRELAERVVVPGPELERYETYHAAQISDRFQEGPYDTLVLVPLLNGARNFAKGVSGRISLPSKLMGFRVSSYGSGTESDGSIKIYPEGVFDLLDELGKHSEPMLVILEDIVDSGHTFDRLQRPWERRDQIFYPGGEPASEDLIGALASLNGYEPLFSALLSKPGRRELEVRIDYLGFIIPNLWVNGYGLDTDGEFRDGDCVWEMKV